MARHQLIGRAAEYQARLLSDLWPGPAGWPIVPNDTFVERAAVSRELIVKRSAGKVKMQEEGHCRLCLRPARAPDDLAGHPEAVRLMTRHHLVPQRWFRKRPKLSTLYRNCDANIVPLCRGCHSLLESFAYGPEYRRMLRRVLTQDEVSFCIQLRGQAWFDLTYPLR